MSESKNIKLNLPSDKPVITEGNQIHCLQWRNWLAVLLAAGIIFAAYESSFMSEANRNHYFGDLIRQLGMFI